VYPETRVSQFISENFIPVRLHVKSHPEAMARFKAEWTPTVLILNANGEERHRVEGFLPADDFLGQLELGAAQVAFGNQQFDEAARNFRKVVDDVPKTDAAAEALYWAGVSEYKASGNPEPLQKTAKAFKERYTDSQWAKKASVWG
jgi:tetratricopeptide (TPR) repeat protein